MKCLLCNNEIYKTIANKLRDGEERNIYYCEECELGILEDYKFENDLKEFYSEKYRKIHKPVIDELSDPNDLFNIYSNFQNDRINLIKNFINPKMKLLEIGCSAGMFLFHIKKYVKDIIGIDYDSRSASFASKKCSCKVFDVDIDDCGLDKGTFDIICMFQVLEHVKDPFKFLKKIREYLTPEGLLYLEIPNLNDALIHAYNLPNHYIFYFHSAHLWYFTEKSINILTEHTGFKGKIFFTQDYNILNHIHWILFDSPQNSCISGISSPSLPLRDSIDTDKKERINSFIQLMDIKYKEMLIELGMTSNISYIGYRN